MSPTKRRIVLRAISIAVSTTPFGLAFGAVAAASGLSVLETVAFSTLVFAGSAQFAAVAILGGGGAVATAVTAGLLLNLRSLAFGILLAHDLRGPAWWRALVSQFVIDESTAVATAERSTADRRFGFLVGGVSVFVLWNLSTLIGVLALDSGGDVISRFGLDAAIPAAFLGLLWSRLSDVGQRRVAFGGALVALALTPFVNPGVAVVSAVAAVAVGWRR